MNIFVNEKLVSKCSFLTFCATIGISRAETDFSSACPGQAGDLRLTRRQAKANALNIFSNNQTYVRSGFLTGNSMGLFSKKQEGIKRLEEVNKCRLLS